MYGESVVPRVPSYDLFPFLVIVIVIINIFFSKRFFVKHDDLHLALVIKIIHFVD